MVLLQMLTRFWVTDSSFWKFETKHQCQSMLSHRSELKPYCPTQKLYTLSAKFTTQCEPSSFICTIAIAQMAKALLRLPSLAITSCSSDFSQGISLRTDGAVSIKCIVVSWMLCESLLAQCWLRLNSK